MSVSEFDDVKDFPVVFSRLICDIDKLIDTVKVAQRENGEYIILCGVGLYLYIVDFEGRIVLKQRMLSDEESGYLQEIQYFREFHKVIFIPKNSIYSMSLEKSREFEVSKEPLTEIKGRGDYYDLTSKFFSNFIFMGSGDNTNLHHLNVETNEVVPHRAISNNKFDVTCLLGVEEKELIFLGGSGGLMVLDGNFEEVVVHKGHEVCAIAYENRKDRIVLGGGGGKIFVLSNYREKCKICSLQQVRAFLTHEVHSCLTDGNQMFCANYLDPFVLLFNIDQFQVKEPPMDPNEEEKGLPILEDVNKEDKVKEEVDKPIIQFREHKQYVNGMSWVNPARRRFFVSCGYSGKVNLFENRLFQEDFLNEDLKERISYLFQGVEDNNVYFERLIFDVDFLTSRASRLVAFRFLLNL